jgi:subtilisin family serine protease
MKTRLAEQVERILDERPEKTVGVIVHVADLTSDQDSVLGEALARNEHSALPARAVLPELVRASRAAAITNGANGGGVPNLRPGTANLAEGNGISAPSMDALRRTNRTALASVLEGELAQRARANRRGAVAEFWTSRSAYLELDRDDLARLPVDMPGVSEVFPNSPVSLPVVSRARDLPAAVVENSAASWGISASGALSVWGAYGARGAGVTVGVLDTGVDTSHPDLRDKVVKWAEFDGQGQPVANSTPHDSGDHGTHVCGTIAGGNASGQWIGMAPETKLAVALVLNGRQGTHAQVLAGIHWAVEQRVDVLSMSLSAPVLGHEAPAAFTEAFRTCLRAGIPVMAAIGNRGGQTGASTGSDFFAFAVGATDHRDIPAGFSGGQTQVVAESMIIPPQFLPLIYIKPDISAPGVDVTSSVPGGSWAAFNGTSMATPHVAGAAALLLSAAPNIRTLTGARRVLFIEDLLKGSVDELGETGHDCRYGFGRLNTLRAVALARSTPPPTT